MKRSIAAAALFATAALAGLSAYQAAVRQRDYGALLERGDNALHDDHTFAAIEAYSGAIALRQDSMIGYLRRGQTYQRRGDLLRAAHDFRTAASLDPSATRPLEALGDVLYQLQRYDRAADAYDRVLRLDDRSARVTYRLALARYRQHDRDGALAAVKEALRLDDRMADAHYLLGLCLRDAARAGDARRAFEKAVALDPGMIPAHEELADLYGVLELRAQELEQLQLLAVLDRDRVPRQVAVSMAHARAGHWDLAVLTLGSALERHPNDADIYRALGQIWLERPREDRAFLSKAREALEQTVGAPDVTSQALTLYARALLQEGNLDAAERALGRATTRFPVELPAFLLYAAAAERNRHLDVARQALVQYVGVSESGPEPALAARIAGLSIRLNDPATAAQWFARALAANPADVRLAAALAAAQIDSGAFDDAQATLDRALDRDPHDPQLLLLARRLR